MATKLREHICQTLAILLSTGVDPFRTIIVQQSRVPELTELMWILGTATTLPSLTGLSQFKDKSKSLKAVPVGLATYPLLQAADVLGYHSSHVLVGSDQAQHLELLKEITRLVDSNEVVIEKIKSALSDFNPEITFDSEKRPAVSNLITLYGEFAGISTDQVVEDCSGLNTLSFKLRLASIINEHLEPIRGTYHQLLSDESTLWEVLENGGKRARQIVTKTLEDVKTIVGFR
uniref:tryptophan--tRNA ligase n=1 Tax=Meloidogyne javanica TaxID=6303 RepID=A0A915N255_MELJA